MDRLNKILSLSFLPASAITGKPVLHFAHANGMPSRVYQPLFDVLAEYFTIEYIEKLGATPGYPVDQHWQSLTQQVLDSIMASCQKHKVPNVVACGHSLGALCSLQALYQEPHLFSQAVLLDPPWIYGTTSFLWHMGKQLDKLPLMKHHFVDKMSPSGISKHRRDVWDNRQQARDSFAKKTFFANFDPRCFEGYIQHGLTEVTDNKKNKHQYKSRKNNNAPTEQKYDNNPNNNHNKTETTPVTLTIPKANEVAVFRTNPSLYWLTPNTPPHAPATLIVGRQSIFLKRKFPQQIKARLRIPFRTHMGGHMFPLEHPESVANMVLSCIVEQAN